MIPGKGIYDRLPIWAQTVAVNVASARNWRSRYGPTFPALFERLKRNEQKSRDELLTDQQTAVQRLLRYAVAHVPYYRALKCSPDDLGDWPILTKATVMAQPDQFLSDEFSTRNLVETRTSGTTGSPLMVYVTRDCYRMEMAFRWRHQAWAGVPLFSRRAFVAGHPVVPATQQRPPFWRRDRVEKRLLCSSYHLAPPNLPAYIEAFRHYAPASLCGYPSALYLLAPVGGYKPMAIFTASETLLNFQRAAIEQGFGAKVFNWYGNTEMTCNIVECAAGNLHYRTDYGVLELLDDGTMLCTGLNNLAMPLIRYRVGDHAFAKDGNCPCGCAFPLIDRIEGRIENYIRTPNGRFSGAYGSLLFKFVRNVCEVQIVQRQLDEIILRVVRADSYTDADERLIRREAMQRLGNNMTVRFEYVDTIERTPAGKFHFIVSELPREQLELPENK